MADIEKVIKGLECCSDDTCDSDCPYKGAIDCIESMCSDALELLKSQPQIVRCKDCKYYNPISGECYRHHFVVYFSNGNWYCADGEHK